MPHVKNTTCPECGKPFTRGGLGFHRLYHHQVPVDKTNAEIKAGKLKPAATPKPTTTPPTPEGGNAGVEPSGTQRRRGGFFSS